MKHFVLQGVMAVLVVGAVVAVYWRNHSKPEIHSLDTGRLMMHGTFGRIQVRSLDEGAGRQAMEGALRRLNELEGLLSTYQEDSELSRVNREAGEGAVAISKETWDVLKAAIEFGRLTEGAMDITISPVLAEWKKAASEGRYPDAVDIEQAKQRVGYAAIVLSEGVPYQVRFSRKGLQVNINAIGEGYLADCVLEALRKTGIVGALVDIGGEVACFGESSPGEPWRVGIQDSFAEENVNPVYEKPCGVLRLKDCAVSTSGNYRRFYTVEGKRVSLIVDPRTGQSAEGLASVTIIAPTAMQADALATAVSVMGPEKGLALIASLPKVEALLIGGMPKEPEYYRSPRFHEYEEQAVSETK